MIASETKRDSKSGWQHPLLALSEEELDLVLQLVLASGSLKDLARVYQVIEVGPPLVAGRKVAGKVILKLR